MRITCQPTPSGRDAYRVDSDSGKTYTVTYCGSGDGDPDYVAVWECTCPAYKYGRGDVCKHIRAVNAIDCDDPGNDVEAGDELPVPPQPVPVNEF